LGGVSKRVQLRKRLGGFSRFKKTCGDTGGKWTGKKKKTLSNREKIS